MKSCFVCGEIKPLEAYYKHSRMLDGHLNKCKECTKSDMNRHRLLNVERIRVYDLDRAKQPHRIEAKTSYTKKYRELNPEKYKATMAVNNAIRDGRLEKNPCEVCGSTDKVEAHHEDYSKPLEVIWRCCVHHNMIHHLQAF